MHEACSVERATALTGAPRSRYRSRLPRITLECDFSAPAHYSPTSARGSLYAEEPWKNSSTSSRRFNASE